MRAMSDAALASTNSATGRTGRKPRPANMSKAASRSAILDAARRVAARDGARDLSLRAPRLGQSTAWLLEQLVPDPTVLSKVAPALTGQQSDASPWRLDMEIQDRQGRSIILKCAPIHVSTGEFTGTVVTFNDISAIRQAESKREETLRFVSHDMRAPQNSILALVYLNSQETDPQKQRDAWSRIGQLARRTLRLVDDFVHLTRAESVRITHLVIDLDMLLHDAMDDFWALAQTRRVDLSIDEDLPQALVCGDRALLLRATDTSMVPGKQRPSSRCARVAW